MSNITNVLTGGITLGFIERKNLNKNKIAIR
jgi:hypothetical protein